jgi:drug/metabolite transporter (DMT)-like permease
VKTDNAQGALWILASAVTFTIMMSLVRLLGDDNPAPLQTFYRQLVGFIILAPLVFRRGLNVFATARPKLLLLRSASSMLGLMLSFYSFQNLPLAYANALSFTRTLWIVPLAVLFLHERVGPVRVAAVVVGFAGVLLMSAPSTAVGHMLATAAGLAAALCLSFTILSLKTLTRDHTPLTLLAWDGLLGLILAVPGALFFWRWPPAFDLMLLVVMGSLGILTQLLYIRGMTIGEAAAMAPVDYSRLVWAAIIGFVVFREVPGATTIAGATIITLSTFLISWYGRYERHQVDPKVPPVG